MLYHSSTCVIFTRGVESAANPNASRDLYAAFPEVDFQAEDQLHPVNGTHLNRSSQKA